MEQENIHGKNVMLIGLGLHAKRIYFHCFNKFSVKPKVVVELESREKESRKYLDSNGYEETKICLIPDEEKDLEELSQNTKKVLKEVILNNSIKYAIISTEPKAHFAYSNFLLDMKINILIDKPITAPIDVCTNEKMARKIEYQYNILADKYRELKNIENLTFKIQCQRRFHDGYIYVKNMLRDVIKEYNVPITYMDIYHSDGTWSMPDEFLKRENHPYKYGYGKLLHSGYHFIDLMCWLLEVNNETKGKQIDNAKMYVSSNQPKDYFNIFHNEDYEKILKTSRFEKILDNPETVAKCGEIDCHSIISFYQKNNLITTCSVNLLQSGFSRRAWHELPEDTYKSNGRVRHERININVGPLMNIQIHSYQAYEIKDMDKLENSAVGSVEHFDIYIFRNSELIGGEIFEKLDVEDICNKYGSENFLGHNEESREKCFMSFMSGKDNISDLLEHKLGIKVLANSYLGICKKEIVKFSC